MNEYLRKISELTREGKIAYVMLKDGDSFVCKADCFGSEENGDTNLLVDYIWKGKRNGGEVLTENQIYSVTEYTESQQ